MPKDTSHPPKPKTTDADSSDNSAETPPTQTQQDTRYQVLIGLTLLSLVTVGITAIWAITYQPEHSRQKPTATQAQPTAIAQTPLPTEPPPPPLPRSKSQSNIMHTLSWEMYLNEKYGFSFKHPDTLTFSEESIINGHQILSLAASYYGPKHQPAGRLLDGYVMSIDMYENVYVPLEEFVKNEVSLSAPHTNQVAYKTSKSTFIKQPSVEIVPIHTIQDHLSKRIVFTSPHDSSQVFILSFEYTDPDKRGYKTIYQTILDSFSIVDQVQYYNSQEKSGWKVYRNSTKGYEISYPKTTFTRLNCPKEELNLCYKEDCPMPINDDEDQIMYTTFCARDFRYLFELHSYKDSDYPEPLSYDSYKIQKEPINVAGINTTLYTSTLKEPGYSPQGSWYQTIILNHSPYTHIFHFSSKEDADVFKQILATFKFLD